MDQAPDPREWPALRTSFFPSHFFGVAATFHEPRCRRGNRATRSNCAPPFRITNDSNSRCLRLYHAQEERAMHSFCVQPSSCRIVIVQDMLYVTIIERLLFRLI